MFTSLSPTPTLNGNFERSEQGLNVKKDRYNVAHGALLRIIFLPVNIFFGFAVGICERSLVSHPWTRTPRFYPHY